MNTFRGAVRPADSELLVSEIFGPTLQGEGPSAGRAATFLRLGMCNLSCVWCDTAYTWNRVDYDLSRELTVWPITAVLDTLLLQRPSLVVVTGGEPLLQRDGLVKLMRGLRSEGCHVEIETNGTISPHGVEEVADLVVVSPKLQNSQQRGHARFRQDSIHEFVACSSAIFKFVALSAADLAEVEEFTNRIHLPPERVWIMPEGRDREIITTRMRELATPVAERGWSLSGRLQVLLWDDERGR